MENELDTMNHGQKERLAFIDFSLQYFGHVARTDLIQRFKTGLAASTRDFSAYKALAPKNLILVHQTKNYHRTNDFKPVFKHDPEVILTSLSRGFGNGISNGIQPSEQCFDAVRLIHPDQNIIAALMRAIHMKQPIECGYVSISSGESTRVIVPHAIVNNGHRWHVRAYDRKHQSFRDFVCTRFTFVNPLAQDINTLESRKFDGQWNNQIELVLVAHPSIQFPKAIELDYAMVEGKLRVKVRSALAAYLLRQWQVDCSQGHKFRGQGCQLALANLDVLTGVENTQLAPGYKV
ncbi:WYL domain-containing protein [Aliiglaciecola aliphaticivorans]